MRSVRDDLVGINKRPVPDVKTENCDSNSFARRAGCCEYANVSFSVLVGYSCSRSSGRLGVGRVYRS